MHNSDPALTTVGGTTIDRQLDSITGKIGSISIWLRKGSGNSGKARRALDSLGRYKLGTIDILQADGSKMIGNNPRPSETVRAHMSEHVDGQFHHLHKFYTLYFGDPAAHLGGVKSGYFQFDGTQRLQLTGGTAQAQVSEVATLVPASDAAFAVPAAATAGEYRVTFNEKKTTTLAFGAANATIDSALADLFIEHPKLAVASSNGMNNVAGLSLTLTGFDYEDTNAEGSVWGIDNNLEVAATSCLVNDSYVAGTPEDGLPSASRNLDVYATRFRTVRVSKKLSDYRVYG